MDSSAAAIFFKSSSKRMTKRMAAAAAGHFQRCHSSGVQCHHHLNVLIIQRRKVLSLFRTDIQVAILKKCPWGWRRWKHAMEFSRRIVQKLLYCGCTYTMYKKRIKNGQFFFVEQRPKKSAHR